VLQSVAECYRVLQSVTVCCGVLQRVILLVPLECKSYFFLQCVSVHYSVLQWVAVGCNTCASRTEVPLPGNRSARCAWKFIVCVERERWREMKCACDGESDREIRECVYVCSMSMQLVSRSLFLSLSLSVFLSLLLFVYTCMFTCMEVRMIFFVSETS